MNVNIYLIKNVQFACSWCLMMGRCWTDGQLLAHWLRERKGAFIFIGVVSCVLRFFILIEPSTRTRKNFACSLSWAFLHGFQQFKLGWMHQEISYKFCLETIVIPSLPKNSENNKLLLVRTPANVP